MICFWAPTRLGTWGPVCFLLSFWAGHLAPAAVLVDEAFAYPDGALISVSDGRWTHHSGNTPGQVEVAGGKLVLTGSETEDVNTRLAGAPYDPAGATNVFYVGMTIRVSRLPGSSGAYFAHFKDAGGSNFRGKLRVLTQGAAPDTYRVGIAFASSSAYATLATNLNLNLDYRLVCRLDNLQATASLWLNPAAESDLSVASTDGGTPITVVAFAFRQANGAGDLTVEDLRVGTTFDEVVGSPPPPIPPTPALSVLTYNVAGNGAEDWSTNSLQVQAIGRQLRHLRPDVVTFNEVPVEHTGQMGAWVAAYLPGYFLATNSGSDGYIRSAIASRFPILHARSWLDNLGLTRYGYSGPNPWFTRDLFEAEIAVPGFEQPMHVFTAHLKAGRDPEDLARRAAEASAISNFFVTTFPVMAAAEDPYVLTGDLNEDVNRPPSGSLAPVARLANTATGLWLTTPRDSVTGDDRTLSSRSLFARYDYILPGGLLFSNQLRSEVFRTDQLSPLPEGLRADDSQTASDHLPVLMVFGHPFNGPFTLTRVAVSNQRVSLEWETAPGRVYRVESSTNLTIWDGVSPLLPAGGLSLSWATNVDAAARFFRVYRVP